MSLKISDSTANSGELDLSQIGEHIHDQVGNLKLNTANNIEALAQLSGKIAHDFNNLLTVILGHVEILQMSDLSAEDMDSVNEIKISGERAAEISQQLLLFGGRDNMQMKPLDLNLLIEEISKSLKTVLSDKIEYKFQPFPEDSIIIEADAAMLGKVMMNLAVNARDAMPQGGRFSIHISLVDFDEESAKVSPDIQTGSYAVISLSDSGIGIPADIISRVFEPFFTTKNRGRGTGLGLSTVLSIINQHNGWVHVYSDKSGTTFRVYLPIAKKEN